MLAITSELMSSPNLFLMDKMSLGLAPVIVLALFVLIGKLNREHGITMLIVMQQVKNLLEISNRVMSSRRVG